MIRSGGMPASAGPRRPVGQEGARPSAPASSYTGSGSGTRGARRMWVATTDAPSGGAHRQVVGVGEAADVVADDRAGLGRLADHRGPPGVDRERQVEAGRQRLDGGHDPLELLGLGDLVAGPGLHPADVEEVGAVGDQLLGLAQEGVEVEVGALVEERVGGAVEDAHHDGPVGDVEAVGAEGQQHNRRT